MLKPEERFALALDAIAPDAVPGSDDLEAEPTDSRALVKAAIDDVMLGTLSEYGDIRAHDGMNTYITLYSRGVRVPAERLLAWQLRLAKALEKL